MWCPLGITDLILWVSEAIRDVDRETTRPNVPRDMTVASQREESQGRDKKPVDWVEGGRSRLVV